MYLFKHCAIILLFIGFARQYTTVTFSHFLSPIKSFTAPAIVYAAHSSKWSFLAALPLNAK